MGYEGAGPSLKSKREEGIKRERKSCETKIEKEWKGCNENIFIFEELNKLVE